ncbi:stage III sporulation protein AG [Paenibacillus sp. ACRRX]|uniref:stage III sporulation protein AG n=1 Tax=unclassified Paenibacillus TaxID=185978 RepID=UPI001EF5578B|nr:MULTISPECIES: stage III sporulation protein AG [unclassified Paenibacillus]MCG7406302.1 stage III sporulation protein AG [Paenibacillus sp. ACRRX]MDK8179337.1 stage III sporulation protein AG [Paenibacillus sp. UMB4589-SE434]
MAKWLQKIESLLGSGPNGSKKLHTFRLLLLFGLIGAALVLFSSFRSFEGAGSWLKGNVGREPPTAGAFQAADGQSSELTPTPGNAFDAIEKSFETRIRSILEEIVGVGQVEVLVTIDSTEEMVIQRNNKDSQQVTEETDANGGKRHTTQYSRDGEIVMTEQSNSHSPIVTKRIKPKVRGVVVVAKGAENAVVKQLIVDAVEKGLNVPSYRISVVPRKVAE